MIPVLRIYFSTEKKGFSYTLSLQFYHYFRSIKQRFNQWSPSLRCRRFTPVTHKNPEEPRLPGSQFVQHCTKDGIDRTYMT